MMSSGRQRSDSNLLHRSDTISRQAGNSSPSQFSQRRVANVPEGTVLNDSASTTNTSIRAQAPSSSARDGSPFRSLGSRGVSPGARPRAHTDQNVLKVESLRYQGNPRMVSSGQMMDNQRPAYLPGPPPLPPSQSAQPHLTNLPPPPPRPVPSAPPANILPPPPGPPPGQFQQGTVYGLPPGWQQGWGRPGMPQMMPPPPPPLNPSQNQSAYNATHANQYRQPGTLSVPPPPPLNDKPILSATFIPGGDSFGPGVGIPPLEDSRSSSTYSRHDGSLYSGYPSYSTNDTSIASYQSYNPADHQDVPPTPLTHTAHAATFPLQESNQPMSPSTQNSNLQSLHSQSQPELMGLQRHGTTVFSSGGTGTHDGSTQSQASIANAQWPLDRVLNWLATNGFSSDWQDTFRALNLHGADFVGLAHGAGGRGNLGKMHQVVYPQLARICTKSGTGWDQNREREEGKRMRKLIKQLVEGTGTETAPLPHRRRESTNWLASASSDGAVENSPNPGRSDATATPSTAGPEGSPGKQMPAKLTSDFGPRNSTQSRSATVPAYGRSSSPTPNESGHPESAQSHTRADISRSILQALAPKGRHSPSASSDSNTLGSHGRIEGSPKSGSPALGHVAPVSASSASPHTHSKNSSIDSKTFTRGGVYAPGYGEALRGGIGGAPGEVPMANRQARPSALEGNRTNSHDKDHGKNFLHNFLKRKKHDPAFPSPDDPALESPTSPAGTFKTPYGRPNSSDTSLGDRSEPAPPDRDRSASRRSPSSREPTSRKYIFATPDHWNYRLIDVTDVDSAESLRRLICSELAIADSDFSQIYFTEAGQQEHAEPLTDSNLLSSHRKKSDNIGSLKFFVKSPASSAISLPVPPSAGLGLSFPKSIPSPPFLRKPIDEETYNRLVASAHGDPSSPYLGSRESTLKGPASSSSTRPSELSSSSGGPEITKVDAETSQNERDAALQRAAEEFKREAERKQRLYQESRLQRNGTHQGFSHGAGIRGNSIIDFDSPRASPFEEKKAENLVPLRRPPTAPSESSTLSKVNSLSKTSTDRMRLSGHSDSFKRKSDPIAEERSDRGRRRAVAPSPSVSHGLGAALANVGKMVGTPAAVANTASSQKPERAMKTVDFGVDGAKAHSPGGSPKSPSHTWAKGNMLFKVPSYEGDGDEPTPREAPPLTLPPKTSVDKLRQAEATPSVSPSTDSPRRPALSTRKSYGPNFDFQEQHVAFAPSPSFLNDDSDEDSDDGLFAIPLAKLNATTEESQEQGSQQPPKAEKPPLSVDTQARHAVTFRSPSTAGGASAGPSSRTPDGDTGSTSARGPFSSDSYSESQSPDAKSKRRASFASNIWADRPPVEGVIDHLDEYFPDIDLDEPYLEEPMDVSQFGGSGADGPIEPMVSSLRDRVSSFGLDGMPAGMTPSAAKDESDTLGSDESTLKAGNRNTVSSITSVAQRNISKSGGGLSRMKSIREVARDRNDLNRHKSSAGPPAVTANVNKSNGILRRKSTKMFGANIVQIKPKPGSRLSTLDPIPQDEIPTEEAPKRQTTFRIIRGELIGKGTYGRVYLGMNANTGEVLAVKQVEVNQKAAHQDKDRIKEMVAALDQEIDTMQHLEHPNIVQYLGCERKEFSISIYLEYISGGSVGSCLRKHGKFEEPVVRSLTRQTLSGLAYLHGEGILHRDLKADNILLDRDGSCKISDFGISKKSDNIYGNDATNSMQGSVFWMAPEVVRSQGQGYSAKVDIWSLGCVVLEMFAGRRPWSREEAVGAIFKLGSLNQAPPIPDDVSDTASVDGLNFMYDCFQTDPSDRPTADTLLRHSTFCVPDPYYNFYDTDLAARLRPTHMDPQSEK